MFTSEDATLVEQLCSLAAPLLVRRVEQLVSLPRFVAAHNAKRALRVTVAAVSNLDVSSVNRLFGGTPSVKVDMEVYHGTVRVK